MGFFDNLSPGLLNILRGGDNPNIYAGLLQSEYGAPAPSPVASAPLGYAPMQSSPLPAPSSVPANPPPVVQAQSASAPQAQPAPADTGYQGGRLGAAADSFTSSPTLIGALFNGIGGALTGHPVGPAGAQYDAANATLQALIRKGIDPQTAAAVIRNPLIASQVIPQVFGPPKAPTPVGGGMIWNPQTGALTQAYDPNAEAKREFDLKNQSPADAAKERAQAAIANGIKPGTPEYQAYVLNGKLPEAKTLPGTQTLSPGAEIIGTDANGQPVVLHKNQVGGEATLSDQTVADMADQYLAGDRTVLQNLGRGAQGAANVVKLREAIADRARAAGVNPQGIVDNFNEQAGKLAGERAVGTRAANISLAANEANNMIDIATKASEAVPRTQYVPINKAMQLVQSGSSSPELARFVAATNSLVNAYVRAVSPTGVPTDSMREHAYNMLNTAQSHEAYVAVTKIMQDEMKAALQAPGQVKKELRGESGGESSVGANPPAGNYVWTPQGLVKQK